MNSKTKRLSKDLDVITQVFISVYSDEYSDFIANRFKQLKIIWYDD